MEWARESLRRTLDRADARRMPYRQFGDPTEDGLVEISSWHARVDDPRVMWVSRVNEAEDQENLWLNLVDLAMVYECATISCQATDLLTTAEQEQAMTDFGFTVESEGHILGAAVASLERVQPALSARPVLNAENFEAALQVSTELWGAPVFTVDEATAASETMRRVSLRKRTKFEVVVRIEDQPVGLGRLDRHGLVGTLEGGATLPAFQRKGAYTAAVDARIWLARISKCRQLLAHTESDAALKVLKSRGLEVIDTTRLYTFKV